VDTVRRPSLRSPTWGPTGGYWSRFDQDGIVSKMYALPYSEVTQENADRVLPDQHALSEAVAKLPDDISSRAEQLWQEVDSSCTTHDGELADRLYEFSRCLDRLHEASSSSDYISLRVFFHSKTLHLRPTSHPQRPKSLLFTAVALYDYLEHNEKADISYLEHAVDCLTENVIILDERHDRQAPDYDKELHGLNFNRLAPVHDLLARRTRNVAHLDRALECHEKVVQLDLPNPSYCNDFAISLIAYHELTGMSSMRTGCQAVDSTLSMCTIDSFYRYVLISG
jgi:hypothetical protein